jgi:hypothetical protein
MASKKERIDYLEVQVAGLQDKLSETIAELEQLKKQVSNAWLIPTTNPVNIPTIWSGTYCFSCGQKYDTLFGHVCPVNPIKITWTNGSGVK